MGAAGGPAKAKETGGFRPASEGRNILMPAVEEFDRWHQSTRAPDARISGAK